MEKTAASPYWTGMTLFTVGSRGAGRRHLMQDVMYKSPGRVAFKGQVFSAPMDVRECECSLSLPTAWEVQERQRPVQVLKSPWGCL